MPSGKTIRRVPTINNRRATPSGKANLGIPSQVPPRVEQERVYPRPLTQRETKDSTHSDHSRRLTFGYSDRAPTLTGNEIIDTSGKTTTSAIPSTRGRSKALSRSNAFRQNGHPLVESDRNRIMAFREAARPMKGADERSIPGRNSVSNRKREDSRSEKLSAITPRKSDESGQGRPPRGERPKLNRLKTDLADDEIKRQVRKAWERGGRGLKTPPS